MVSSCYIADYSCFKHYDVKHNIFQTVFQQYDVETHRISHAFQRRALKPAFRHVFIFCQRSANSGPYKGDQ